MANAKCQRAKSLAGDEGWAVILEPALCNNPATAEALTHLLYSIKEAIDSGPDGIKRASNTLLAGIRLAYLYTDAHKAALKLYLLSLTGDLKPEDEPLQLINGAIERGTDEINRTSAAEHRRRTRSLKKKRR